MLEILPCVLWLFSCFTFSGNGWDAWSLSPFPPISRVSRHIIFHTLPVLKTAVYRGTESGMARRRRIRLYPRGYEVLEMLTMPGARLVWNEQLGKYTVDGRCARRDTVIARTRATLLELNLVRPMGVNADLHITPRGRRMLLRYQWQNGSADGAGAWTDALRTTEQPKQSDVPQAMLGGSCRFEAQHA